MARFNTRTSAPRTATTVGDATEIEMKEMKTGVEDAQGR